MPELYKCVPKLHLLANEAERYNVKRSLSVRDEQPIPVRLFEVGLSRTLKMARVINCLTRKMGENFPGYEYLGQGAEQLVFGDEEKVLKLLIRSAQFPDFRELPEQTAVTMQRKSDECKDIFGDIWVPTTFSAVPLPHFKKPQIIASQPNLVADREFAHINALVDDPEISPDAKQDFADRVNQLYETKGMLPDLIGRGNIQAVSNATGELALRVVDTIPVVNIERAKSLWPGRTQSFFDETYEALDRINKAPIAA